MSWSFDWISGRHGGGGGVEGGEGPWITLNTLHRSDYDCLKEFIIYNTCVSGITSTLAFQIFDRGAAVTLVIASLNWVTEHMIHIDSHLILTHQP